MPRPDRSAERRRELLPVVARTFADLGYRRTTTAELARRCEIQENILYRLWDDKRAMFLEALTFVYDNSEEVWTELLVGGANGPSVAERLLAYEADHHGELGLYRIVFAGLTESDDPEIRRALVRMYRRFHRFVADSVARHRGEPSRALPSPEDTAWALLGLGTVSSIIRELRLLPAAERKRTFLEAGRALLAGVSAPRPQRQKDL